VESAIRAEELTADGDSAGAAVWRRVTDAIGQLVNMTPSGTDAVNGGNDAILTSPVRGSAMPDWRKNGSVTEHLKNDLLSRRASHRVGRLRHSTNFGFGQRASIGLVKREFPTDASVSGDGADERSVPGYVKDHMCRSAAVVLMRSQICSGKRRLMRRLKIGGKRKAALGPSRSLPCRHPGSCIGNRRASRASRAPKSHCR
jgi:hypothetical protein